MPRRLLALFTGLLLLSGACSSSDDAPSATLAPLAPVASAPPSTGGGSAVGGGAVPPSALPAPPQLLTQGDLDGVPSAAGVVVGTGMNPNRIAGLCGEAIDYNEVWRAIVRRGETEMVFGQTVFQVADEATAEAFIAKLQSAPQGCSWEHDPLRFEYAGQETGVQPVGDAMFAYRLKLGRIGKDAPADASLIVYVQQGDMVILLHGPPKVDLELVNAALAAATA